MSVVTCALPLSGKELPFQEEKTQQGSEFIWTCCCHSNPLGPTTDWKKEENHPF